MRAKLLCAIVCVSILMLAGCPNNPLSPPVTPAPTPVQLAAPTVTPNAGDTKATLSWPAVPNAASYELVWNGGVSKPVTSPHEETGLVNGTAYTYKLIAKGDGSSYTDSEAAEGTVHPAAGGGTASVKLAKPVVTALASDTKATLSWPAVPNTVSYELVWNGGVSKPVTSPHEETGLVNGTAYTYKLIAKGDGSSYTDSHAALGSVTPEMKLNPAMISVMDISTTINGSETAAIGSRDAVFRLGRTVILSPYAISKYETTYELWYKVCQWATGKQAGDTSSGEKPAPDALYSFYNVGKEGGYSTASAGALPTTNKTHPVTSISWRDAIIWCNAYTEMTMGTGYCVYRDKTTNTVLRDAGNGGDLNDSPKARNPAAIACDESACALSNKGYRLPTEAEWEFAARGGSQTQADWNYTYAGGNDLNVVAWWGGNSMYTPGGYDRNTHPVSGKKENLLGLYDMSGNVKEWCLDYVSSTIDTTTVTDPTGSTTPGNRSVRGGTFVDTYQDGFNIRDRDAETVTFESYYLGFRVARTK